jgi:hypothetical protein
MALLSEGVDNSRFLSPETEPHGRVPRTQGIPVSSLGPVTGSSDRVFFIYLSPTRQMSEYFLKLDQDPSFHILPNLLFINRHIIKGCIRGNFTL